MKKLAILLLPLVLLASCSKIETDPVGEPYKIKLRVIKTTNAPQSIVLSALVAYGGFGSVKSTVTFFNGQEIVSKVSAPLPYEDSDPKLGETFSEDFQTTVNLQPNITYNLTARVDWTLSGVNKSLTSAVVNYPSP